MILVTFIDLTKVFFRCEILRQLADQTIFASKILLLNQLGKIIALNYENLP